MIPLRLCRAAALAGLGLLSAAPATALPVTVRGGEHGPFTRLVLTIPPGAAWHLEPVAGGLVLHLSAGAPFDLRRAFDRIGRSRIAALADEGAGRLRLRVPCDCHAEAFLFRPGGLVIDVHDGPGALAPLPSDGPEPALPPDAAASAPPLAPPVPDRAARPSLAAATEGDVLRGVADAASRGLLDPVPPQAGHLNGAPPPPWPEPGGRAPGLALRSGADRDDPAAPPALGRSGERCRPPSDFAIADWAAGADFGAETAPLLARLTDARDKPDPDTVEALARTFLAFGFGREAERTLDLDGAASRERDGLRLLARLIEGEDQPAGALADQAGCLGPVALWGALARGSMAGADPHERAAIVVALRALPPPLRSRLAPPLARLALADGDAEGAGLLLKAAPEGIGGVEVAVLEAGIAGLRHGPGAEIAALSDLARHEPRLPAGAMVRLLHLLEANGTAAPEDLLALARLRRAELRHEPEALALLLGEARLRGAAGSWDAALDLLAEARRVRPGAAVEEALSGVIADLVRQAPDADFLTLALTRLPPRLPERAGNAVARRLLAMGFPDAAAERLSGPLAGRAGRLLLAEAALALGDPARALAALDGLRGERAESLRRAALAPAPPAPSPADPPPPPDGPLAAGRIALDQAAAARLRALALLDG